MNEHSARPLRFLAVRAAYDFVCVCAVVIAATTGLLLYLEFGQLTVPSRLVLAAPPVVVAAGLANRYRRHRARNG